MAYRPYFKHGIEQLQALVATSGGDLKALKVIQYELGFRDRPKAKALKREVDVLVRRLLSGGYVPPARPEQPTPPPPPPPVTPTATPNRVVVECANCKTPNFVSTLDEVVQHLSCSACRSPYEAMFKYGVMRTTFQARPPTQSDNSALKWGLLAVAVMVVLWLMAH